MRQERRKKLSVLFLDIVGSTTLAERLDPEPLRQVMDRYFAACGTVIAEHGGAVEKFIGDAILAAFGAIVSHEDDALRAVRAAAGALAALRDLSAELEPGYQVRLEARCGICTGDVVVITAPDGDFRAVGDTVNTASRLQTAARPGEILLCADTAAMVRSRVGIEPVTPLALKGKSRPVPAWRVTDPAGGGDGAGPMAPLIGRDDELEELRHAFRRVTRRRQVCLVTVLGPPGIGKSRLVREFLAGLPGDAATVLSGRCSAYGRGITYKPLAEMLGSYPGGWTALSALLSADSLAARSLATIMRDQAPYGASPADRAGPAGIDPTGVEDIAWAVRHLLDSIGRARPAIVVLEDLHWSEQTLLDLIDNVATWVDGVPVLLLCVARSELLESRPSWGGGKPCAMTLELGPLTYEQSATLVAELALHGDVYPQEYHEAYSQVAAQCDGNPLFAELILDVFAENAPGIQIPPTIQALFGARLDQLPAPERTLLELAAMAGRECGTDVLGAMAAESGLGPGAAEDLLARLTRRRILERAAPGTYRFAQTLLRDTAYAFTPKAQRSRWHEFLAQWFDARRDGMAVAYHVEAASQLHRELRPGAPALPRLAGAAAAALIAEGRSALGRKDLPAALALMERGRALLPPGDPRHTRLALHICDAGVGIRDAGRALAALDAARAAMGTDRQNATACAIQRCIVALRLGLAPPAGIAAETGLIAAELAADPDDDLSWCRLHQLQAYLRLVGESTAAAEASMRLALARARAMADPYEEDRLLLAVCELAQWAPGHVSDGLGLCAALAERFAANRGLLVPVLVTKARLTALAGDIDGARATLANARGYSGDLHLDLTDAAVQETSGFVEALAGAHEAAEAHYRRCRDVLRAAQHAPDTQNTEVAIARALFDQGRAGAAALALARVEAEGEVTSPRAAIAAAALRALIASARQEPGQPGHEEAVAAARTALALSEGSDDPCLAAETLSDVAVVFRAAGLAGQARATAALALRKFADKGAELQASRLRSWIPDQDSGGGE